MLSLGFFCSMLSFSMFRCLMLTFFLYMGLSFLLSSFIIGFFMFMFFGMAVKFGDNFTLLFGLLMIFCLVFDLSFDFWFCLGFCLLLWFLLYSLFFVMLLGFLTLRFFCSRLSGFVLILEFGSSELSGHVANSSPVLDDLFLLSAHLDEKSPVEYFFIVIVSDEIDSVDSHFKNNFERTWVIVFDFDQIEFGEGFSDVVLGGVKIALDQVQGNVLDILIELFDGLDEVVAAGHRKLFLFVVLVLGHFLWIIIFELIN